MGRRARKILPGEDDQAKLRAYLVEARANVELQLFSLKGFIIGVDVSFFVILGISRGFS
jgi:hypothetical protein